MPYPLLYELNARSWLADLSAREGQAMTLADVPEAELSGWRRLGFTHIWLMGVWPTSPLARAFSRAQTALREEATTLLPDFTLDDLVGSPFAIAGYHVPEASGGEAALAQFRQRLATHGLKLVLDFIPNHVGLGHPWTVARPELFVQSDVEHSGAFVAATDSGLRWLAHGRDPNFPPWTDTVQLDHRRAATRAAVIDELRSLASRCDGVRCDMAVLLLERVFANTWAEFPVTEGVVGEFWTEAIRAVKDRRPDFLFLAEAYWDVEPDLQALGFDFTYDKRVLDHLVARRSLELNQRLHGQPAAFHAQSAHFLENHDEARAAAIFSWPEHRAVSLLLLGLPGLRLLHNGQLMGSRHHVHLSLGRQPREEPLPEVAAWYEQLLTTLPATAVGRGRAELLRPRPAWLGSVTAPNFVLIQWQADGLGFDLVVVNLSAQPSQCYAPLTVTDLAGRNWQMKNLVGDESYQRKGDELQQRGLYLDVPGHAAQLFQFTPSEA